ncbi:MAG: hypothetical protein AB6733_07990 [Clostridiaceae bacterium]
MRNEQLERSINKLDRDIAALNLAKKYLSNKEEIIEVVDSLNNKRQLMADEIYREDHQSYFECRDVILPILDKVLEMDEQVKLLEEIKEKFGRQSPNVSKKSTGLNAWLKELNIEYRWIESEDTEWNKLVISGFGIYKQQ